MIAHGKGGQKAKFWRREQRIESWEDTMQYDKGAGSDPIMANSDGLAACIQRIAEAQRRPSEAQARP
jgi:hypothetical protein